MGMGRAVGGTGKFLEQKHKRDLIQSCARPILRFMVLMFTALGFYGLRGLGLGGSMGFDGVSLRV